MKIAIALFGDHSGELDRYTFNTTENKASDDIRTELDRLVTEWTINPGDVIRIIELEG